MPLQPRQRGISLIYVAVLLPVLIGFVGLAIDSTYIVVSAQQLQAAADAAALDGAMQLPTIFSVVPGTPTPTSIFANPAQVAANNRVGGAAVLVRTNADNDPGDGDVIYGVYSPTATPNFTPTLHFPNAVQITARRDTFAGTAGPLSLLFGPIFGVNHVNIKRQAIGILNIPPAVLALSPVGPGLIINSQAMLSPYGPVTVNASGEAVRLSDHGAFDPDNTAVINILQGATITSNGSYLPPVIQQLKPTADSLAGLPEPAQGTLQSFSPQSSGSWLLNAGYYPNGISISGTASVTLQQPGVYVLAGAGLQVSGAASLQSSGGVLLYIAANAQLNLSGTGSINLSPDPSSSDVYGGVVIMQDQPPASGKQPVIQGSGQVRINGAIYLPKADLTISGISAEIGTQIIANTVTVTGNGIVSTNYNYNNRPAAEQPMPYLAQ